MTDNRAKLIAKILEPILLLALCIPTLAIAITWGPLGYPVGAMFLTVVTGWVNVGWRGLTQAEMDLAGILTGGICIVAVIALLHLMAAWLYREVRVKNERTDWPTAWHWRWTLGLTAGVVMMFVAGLVGVGLFRTTTWFLQTEQHFVDDRRIQ